MVAGLVEEVLGGDQGVGERRDVLAHEQRAEEARVGEGRDQTAAHGDHEGYVPAELGGERGTGVVEQVHGAVETVPDRRVHRVEGGQVALRVAGDGALGVLGAHEARQPGIGGVHLRSLAEHDVRTEGRRRLPASGEEGIGVHVQGRATGRQPDRGALVRHGHVGGGFAWEDEMPGVTGETELAGAEERQAYRPAGEGVLPDGRDTQESPEMLHEIFEFAATASRHRGAYLGPPTGEQRPSHDRGLSLLR